MLAPSDETTRGALEASNPNYLRAIRGFSIKSINIWGIFGGIMPHTVTDLPN